MGINLSNCYERKKSEEELENDKKNEEKLKNKKRKR